VVAIKCTASLGKAKVITYGEATPKNNKNGYPYAMAEKRAVDRAILKLIGIHGFVYSDDEVNEPMLIETTHPVPKLHIANNQEKIDDIYIATTLEVIEKNPHKKNSTTLRSDLENLKTRMFKVKLKNGTKWDEFKKSKSYPLYVSLQNKHKPKRS
jgi:alpha-D-ribose 1-methylphosphonate 5-phosphate C-P lyase